MSFSFSRSACGHVLLAHVARIDGRNVHRNVMHQSLELRRAGNKVALAVHFQQHADLAPGVDVAGHHAFAGRARRLLGCRRHAALAQHHNGLLQIAIRLGKRLLAVHHGSPGLFAKLFNHACRNLCHCKTFLRSVPPGQARLLVYFQLPVSNCSASRQQLAISSQFSQNDPRRRICSAGRFSRNIRECPVWAARAPAAVFATYPAA